MKIRRSSILLLQKSWLENRKTLETQLSRHLAFMGLNNVANVMSSKGTFKKINGEASLLCMAFNSSNLLTEEPSAKCYENSAER